MNYLKLVIFSLLFFFACGDPCDDVTCQNDGVCEDGTCLCLDGYSGVNCEVEKRAIYLGMWSGEFLCDDSPGNELEDSEAHITVDPNNVSGILIELDGVDLCAVFNDEDEMMFSKIITGEMEEFVVAGQLEIVNDMLLISLTVTEQDGTVYSCDFTLEK